MINKEELENLLLEELSADELVLVELKITANNVIKIIVDSLSGVPISKCIEISRFVERSLDRDKEDFELEVSSYSIVSPFVLPLHYKKNVGRKVEIQTTESTKPIKGILHSVEFTDDESDVNFVEILQTKKVKPEGKKKKIEVEEIFKIKGNEIKRSKLII